MKLSQNNKPKKGQIIKQANHFEEDFDACKKDSKANTTDNSNFCSYNMNDKSLVSYYRFSKDEVLCSFLDQEKTIILQRDLRNANKDIIEYIVNELRGYYRTIIIDKNGNYFISDLIKICEQKHRIIVLKELSPTISEDCLNTLQHILFRL